MSCKYLIQRLLLPRLTDFAVTRGQFPGRCGEEGGRTRLDVENLRGAFIHLYRGRGLAHMRIRSRSPWHAVALTVGMICLTAFLVVSTGWIAFVATPGVRQTPSGPGVQDRSEPNVTSAPGRGNLSSLQAIPDNGSQAPPLLSEASMVWDPRLSADILFGGCLLGGDYTCAPGALNETWAFNGLSWAQLTPPVSPPPLYESSMAYDPTNGEVVLFGGVDQNSSAPSVNYTWEFNGTSWANITPAMGPSPRSGAAIAVDPQPQWFGSFWWFGFLHIPH